ncbi:MAG: cytochrome P450, partial [Solirubrobacterales bacterium]
MAAEPQQDLDQIAVADHENWEDGPPHEIFRRLRRECPVHWSEINTWENEEGFWSVTRADNVRAVSLDWEAFSSERGGVTGLTNQIPLELIQSMFI